MASLAISALAILLQEVWRSPAADAVTPELLEVEGFSDRRSIGR